MDCKAAQQMILPYIQRKLNGKELEHFIGHIKGCPDCHEELEIYFTIYFALERLDDESHMSYNIQKLLVDDLHASEHRVHRGKILRFYRYCIMLLAEAALLVLLFTQFQIWTGDVTMQQTAVYEMIYGSPLPDTKEELEDLREKPQIYETETKAGREKQTEPIGQTEQVRQTGQIKQTEPTDKKKKKKKRKAKKKNTSTENIKKENTETKRET